MQWRWSALLEVELAKGHQLSNKSIINLNTRYLFLAYQRVLMCACFIVVFPLLFDTATVFKPSHPTTVAVLRMAQVSHFKAPPGPKWEGHRREPCIEVATGSGTVEVFGIIMAPWLLVQWILHRHESKCGSRPSHGLSSLSQPMKLPEAPPKKGNLNGLTSCWHLLAHQSSMQMGVEAF